MHAFVQCADKTWDVRNSGTLCRTPQSHTKKKLQALVNPGKNRCGETRCDHDISMTPTRALVHECDLFLTMRLDGEIHEGHHDMTIAIQKQPSKSHTCKLAAGRVAKHQSSQNPTCKLAASRVAKQQSSQNPDNHQGFDSASGAMFKGSSILSLRLNKTRLAHQHMTNE